jgi:hypothetical protein
MTTTQTPPPAPATAEALPRPSAALGIRTTAPPEGGWAEGYPKVFFSVWERLPPKVVFNAEDEEGIDKRYWMTVPPEAPEPAENPV